MSAIKKLVLKTREYFLDLLNGPAEFLFVRQSLCSIGDHLNQYLVILFFKDNDWINESVSRGKGICVNRRYIKMC